MDKEGYVKCLRKVPSFKKLHKEFHNELHILYKFLMNMKTSADLC
jgi:hypothetical protein